MGWGWGERKENRERTMGATAKVEQLLLKYNSDVCNVMYCNMWLYFKQKQRNKQHKTV